MRSSFNLEVDVSFLSEREKEERKEELDLKFYLNNELFLLNHHVPDAEGKRVAVFTKLGVFLPTEKQYEYERQVQL